MVRVNTLPKVLNCSRPQAFGLLDEQILRRIAVGEDGAPGRTQKAVPARCVRDSLEALAASAPPIETVPAHCVPVSKAAERAKTSSAEIVHLVLGGFLSEPVIASGGAGLAALHVDPIEVREVIEKHLVGMSIASVIGRMHLPVRTVWALIEEREGGALLASCVVHAPNGRHSFRRIRLEEVERFRKEFRTPVQLAIGRQAERRLTKRELLSARLRPAIRWDEVGLNFFRTEGPAEPDCHRGERDRHVTRQQSPDVIPS